MPSNTMGSDKQYIGSYRGTIEINVKCVAMLVFHILNYIKRVNKVFKTRYQRSSRATNMNIKIIKSLTQLGIINASRSENSCVQLLPLKLVWSMFCQTFDFFKYPTRNYL